MATPKDPILLADTITKLGAESVDKVVISGSHGGVYPGFLAHRAGARAVILNDAGVGKDHAGIGSLPYCEALAMAAATIAHDSARIGDTSDMMRRGIISHANTIARAAGCLPGMPCREAAQKLLSAPPSRSTATPYREGRTTITELSGPRQVVCLDSASLVSDQDTGQILLIGSHGGLINANPALALQVDARAAVFNDAGVGIDNAGITRLPVLARRNIAAATVATASARIGDGRSTCFDGILSHVNTAAARLGARPGMSALDFIALMQQV